MAHGEKNIAYKIIKRLLLKVTVTRFRFSSHLFDVSKNNEFFKITINYLDTEPLNFEYSSFPVEEDSSTPLRVLCLQ